MEVKDVKFMVMEIGSMEVKSMVFVCFHLWGDASVLLLLLLLGCSHGPAGATVTCAPFPISCQGQHLDSVKNPGRVFE